MARSSRSALLVGLASLLLAAPLAAGGVREVWRSPLGDPRFIAVNAADGSSWATFGNVLVHLGAQGDVLGQVLGFLGPRALAVNSTDGSCWIADTLHGRVVRFAADGSPTLARCRLRPAGRLRECGGWLLLAG